MAGGFAVRARRPSAAAAGRGGQVRLRRVGFRFQSTRTARVGLRRFALAEDDGLARRSDGRRGRRCRCRGGRRRLQRRTPGGRRSDGRVGRPAVRQLDRGVNRVQAPGEKLEVAPDRLRNSRSASRARERAPRARKKPIGPSRRAPTTRSINRPQSASKRTSPRPWIRVTRQAKPDRPPRDCAAKANVALMLEAAAAFGASKVNSWKIRRRAVCLAGGAPLHRSDRQRDRAGV